MKNNLLRLLIIAPFLVIGFLVVQGSPSSSVSREPSVLGSSIIITVGDSGITCTSKAQLTLPKNFPPLNSDLNNSKTVDIDGVAVKGAPLGLDVTYQIDCTNTGITPLTGLVLTNPLTGANQNYLTYKSTNNSDCSFNNPDFICNPGNLAVGAKLSRSFIVTVASDILENSVAVTNVATITADGGIAAPASTSFSIYKRPACGSLTHSPSPVVASSPATFTGIGTTYDNAQTTYIFSVGAVAVSVQSGTTYSQSFVNQAEPYYTTLAIRDSLGNASGDPSNCSAACANTFEVAAAPSQCVSGLTLTPSSGPSPLSVTAMASLTGTFTMPLTSKVYDSSTLIKQVSGNSNNISVLLSFTNDTQSPVPHLLSLLVYDSAGKLVSNLCEAAILVQPAVAPPPPPTLNQHYACVSATCTLLNSPGINSCTVGGTECVVATHYACVNNACTLVNSAGANTCIVGGSECAAVSPPVVSHYACVNSACTRVNSAGVSTCTLGGTECAPLVTHLECNATSLVCEAVVGAGVDSCSTNAQCAVISPSGPHHFVCNQVRKSCDSYYGNGVNTCKISSDCTQFNGGTPSLTGALLVIGGSLLLGGFVTIMKLLKK
ncbi:MAG: hypothetical protein NT141_02345 [candidate division WWE3 bacterium]|nr:hypothetical protein [candidate division WWE3 bacterium]